MIFYDLRLEGDFFSSLIILFKFRAFIYADYKKRVNPFGIISYWYDVINEDT